VPTVGLDVGGTKCLGVLLDDAGAVLAERRRPTPTGTPELLATLVELTAELEQAAGVRAAAVGVGMPGLVDRAGGLRAAPHLPWARDLPLAERLAEHLGRPVVVDNDATCALEAEAHDGAARGVREAVLVTLGTGIGAAWLTEGAIRRGHHGFAGEAGHMVVEAQGLRCPCGRRGCWERYASGSGLGRVARDAVEAGEAPRVLALAGGDPDAVRGEHLSAAAAEGDPAALEVLERFAWWVALGLANLTNLLDPERIVVGGGLVRSGDLLLAPVRAELAGLLFAADRRRTPDVVAAELGEQAGARGAALVAARAAAQEPWGT